MLIKPISSQDREAFNRVVTHPLQSYEWGEFREKTGIKVIRRGAVNTSHEKPLSQFTEAFQLTIHPLPYLPWTIGYLPKGNTPTKEILAELRQIGREEKCIFIQIEPNIVNSSEFKVQSSELGLVPSARPLFTKHTFVLDLTKSEEELLNGMHPKTRYNIKVATKHGVQVTQDNSDNAFETYWKLMEETTKRQGFYAHTKKYHTLQWKIFGHSISNSLTSHLFTAQYQGQILTTMMFFIFHDTLYYPYGASSSEHRNLMHSTLTMWEAIRWGRSIGLKKFDMWGALGPEPNPKDPWFGFHDFKRKYGPEHVEFVGSYDLILQPVVYRAYTAADTLRWLYLRLKK